MRWHLVGLAASFLSLHGCSESRRDEAPARHDEPSLDDEPTELASCEGMACVATGTASSSAVVLDATNHPVVAYSLHDARDTVRVRRWNGTRWEDLGAPRTNRLTAQSRFQLHVLRGKLVLVTASATSEVRIEQLDDGVWTDVAGSPIAVTHPNPNSARPISLDIDSVSRDDILHIATSFDDNDGAFHVRRWDGITFAAETEAEGVGTNAARPILGIAPDGSIAAISARVIAQNIPGTTTWKVGTQPVGNSNPYTSAFVWTNAGGVYAQLLDYDRTAIVARGDATTPFVALGPNEGALQKGMDTLGTLQGLLDHAGRPCFSVPSRDYYTPTITNRLKCFDGASWVTVVSGAAVRASSSLTVSSATLEDRIFAAVGGRGFPDASGVGVRTEYLHYEQLALP